MHRQGHGQERGAAWLAARAADIGPRATLDLDGHFA
jgi:hypothetical protein